MSSQNTQMYREHILDHYKNPRNAGILQGAASDRELNPLCGDDIEFFIKGKNGIVADVRFRGNGCAISQAAASMLSEAIKGKRLEEVEAMGRDDIIGIIGIPVSPARIKCATLGLVAAKKSVEKWRKAHG